MSSAHAEYEQFRQLQRSLADVLEKARPQFAALDMSGWDDTARKLAARVASERFRVMVLGEFKRGKSTVINALLQEEVLPAFPTPCTAVINEIKWADEKKAVLHFRQPPPSPVPAGLPKEALRHFERHRTAPQMPPLEIDVRELEAFVVIPDPGKDQAESIAESPYDRVEVYWPLDLCRNGVEIIDSPGLNEHRTRTKTTKDYLAHIDAVVFVMSVHALAGESELAVVDHDLRGSGHEYLFFVCNRFDELRKAADRDRVVQYATDKLAGRTRFGREGLFFLSALDALEGRLEGDAARVQRSGLVPLETALARFLVQDRGRVKLMQPATQLARGIKAALFETIPGRRRMLQDDLTGLRTRYEQARPQLEQAARRRDQVLRAFDGQRHRLKEQIRREAMTFFRQLGGMVPAWGAQLETQGSIRLIPGTVDQQVKKLTEEVVRLLQPRVEAAIAEWEQRELRPILEQGLEEMTEGVSDSLRDFFDHLDAVRGRLTGGLVGDVALKPALADGQVQPLERVLAGVGGLFLGGPGVALAGTLQGFQGVVTNILPHVALAVGAMILGVTNPLAIAAILLGTGLGQALMRGGKLTAQVKQQVAEGLGKHLAASAPDHAEQVAQQVYDQTEVVAEAIAAGLEKEIAGVREQVESVLKLRQEGEAKVAEQLKQLDAVEQSLRVLEADTAALIETLAAPKR